MEKSVKQIFEEESAKALKKFDPDVVAKKVEKTISDGVENTIAYMLGIRKDHWSSCLMVSQDSLLFNSIKEATMRLSNQAIEQISLIEPKLTDSQIRAIQREYDRAYVGHLKDKARQVAKKQAEEALASLSLNFHPEEQNAES